MTATLSISATESSVAPARAARGGRARDWITWAVTIALLLTAYLLLQNPYWVPGGDSEVYIAIARNLATGHGYIFNGQPVSMVPPGWPWFLAAAMLISPTFLLLKLLTMSCMLGSLAIMYWVCRRFAGPMLCALVIFCTGMLSYSYDLTFWLHSDALFCLLSSAALLVAMQINEDKGQVWRGLLLVGLCAAAVIVRWAGLLTWLTVAAALLQGELLPRRNDLWFRFLTTGLITFLTFFTVRTALRVSPEVAKLTRDWTSEDSGAPVAIEKVADKKLAVTYDLFNVAQGGIRGYIARGFGWGNWYSYLIWQPLRLGRTSTFINLISLVFGWAVLVPVLIGAWRATWRKRWIWTAVVLYSLALAMNWPQPNSRYLVPIAPLIVLGVFKGFGVIREHFPAPAVINSTKIALGYFAASILLCNGALYAVDVTIARSKDFYANYEAGLNRDLIHAAYWLNEHPPKDQLIAVSERYENLGRWRRSPLGLRVTTMLTGQPIVSVPIKYVRNGDPRRNPHFLDWARAPDVNVKYVLYQPPVSPWRVFHFRMGWLQELMTGESAIDTGAGWRLYEIPRYGDEAIRISVERVPHWPTRVPGM